MNEIFWFNEDENVKDIQLTTLSKSLMIRDAKGQPPKNRPIQSWELIADIFMLCKQANLDAQIAHIYVPKSGANPVINANEKELFANGDNIPIDKWLFNRVAFLIQLHHKEDTDMVTAIVGSFHDKGIQIAWGQHVNLCSNMTIFGGNSMYTFGEDKMPFEKINEVLQKWILEFEAKRAADIEIINKMKHYAIDDIEPLMDAIVGRLYRNAVKAVYLQGNAPVFNITQCSSFVQEFEARLKEWSELNEGVADEPITLWKVYNWGTAILSPENTDVTSVYKTVVEWGNFLVDFMKFEMPLTEEQKNLEITAPSAQPVEPNEAPNDYIAPNVTDLENNLPPSDESKE